ncbi:MAG: glutamate--tRNA ligase [Chloroflexi bacterium]|nr:glutamate--tRNA ligase [Chloroflexota bacterium]MCY4248374.1 glutamate--tRNA ligase [Chloroflexota bacterium]
MPARDQAVRARYAPSPTGPQHIGGIRSALFGWLFARRHGGQFILRIEDTDQKRSVRGSVEQIVEAFAWLGLDIDEGPHVGGDYGPYVQSQRLDQYQRWANWLVEQGHAYRCFATPDELAEMRKAGRGYDRRYRDFPADRSAEQAAQGMAHVIRFKMPLAGTTRGKDLIRGEVAFDNAQLQDAVLLKSDGFPTYHLAHIVDDHAMRISHITRAVEWLPSFPLHLHIWEAFGWEKPQFAHLPVLLNPNGKGKLSKRRQQFADAGGKSVPVLVHEFQSAGYLPEAVVNFLTNIGWNFGDDREVFTNAEAIARFALQDVNPANSAYPIAKLDWLNSQWIQRIHANELASRLKPALEAAGYAVDESLLRRVAPTLQVRLKSLRDVAPMAGFFFADWNDFAAPPAEILIQRKMDAAGTRHILQSALPLLAALDDFSPEAQHAAIAAYAASSGLKNGAVFGSLRAAVSGQRVSPPTFDVMAILGKAESLRRIKLAVAALETAIA